MPAGWQKISGSRRIGSANGVFPGGCKWRDVEAAELKRGFWDVTEYEYWSEQSQTWVSKMPDACMVMGEKGAPK